MDIIRNTRSFTLSYPSLSFINKKTISITSLRQLNPPLLSLQTNPFPKLSVYKTSTTDQVSSFTVDYLVRSCGLSLEAATSASLKIQLDSPEKPNSVLTLLKTKGFTKTQISKLIKKRPFLLLAHPQNTLLPKLEFFYSIGVSNSDLARILTSDPTVLTRSLENQIIPSYNYLKSILFANEKIVSALKRTTWIFLEDHSKNLGPNIELLSEVGVPHSCVSLLLTHFPEAMMQRHGEFGKTVKEVNEMGFDPKKSTFVLAVHAISGEGNKSIWKRCFEVYSRWGWSKDEIFAAFNKHPHCMMLSEKKIMRTMDFFVNKMGLSSKVIADCPVVLFFSLEKRIIPRCRVIQVLMNRGLVKDVSLATVLIRVEGFFLERFVTKFEEEVPQLLSVYQGKIDPDEV
ncbi:transcription termination factor MTERF8, chloroplastic [Mercurialis annua]|uniref:transcription termination factor MTERF8, chloroplastic n=1 Tax=Mercurialis annua TaxID=3986 RepID=UPI00215F33EA|nr:transcription termination factor MTERF8, chloroplastic [Mercurialis annua]